VINHRRSLLWGYGGVNICPTVVPAPDDTVDVDEYIEYNDDTIEEDDEFSELIEYIDNQRW